MSLKQVGLSHPIKFDWMNLTALEVSREIDHVQIAKHLDEHLREEIQGSESRRKSINSLIRIWAKIPESQIRFQQKAIKLFIDANADERIWLHWGMTLTAYPIFTEAATTIGKLLKLQTYATSGQVHRDIYSNWGQRSTLTKSIQSILTSMKDWGVLQYDSKLRRYIPGKKYKTNRSELESWFIEAFLRSVNKQINIQQLNNTYPLFPLTFKIKPTEIIKNKEFLVNSNYNEESWIKLRI